MREPCPMGLIERDLEGYFRALDAARLPPSGKAFVYPARETPGTTTDDRRQCLYLAVIGVLIDIEPSDPGRLARPEIALPTADPHEAQVVELNVAVMALADMPEQHRLAEAVIRGLSEGARTGNRAAAVVEPVADNVPVRNIAHEEPPFTAGIP